MLVDVCVSPKYKCSEVTWYHLKIPSDLLSLSYFFLSGPSVPVITSDNQKGTQEGLHLVCDYANVITKKKWICKR